MLGMYWAYVIKLKSFFEGLSSVLILFNACLPHKRSDFYVTFIGLCEALQLVFKVHKTVFSAQGCCILLC